MGGGMLPIPGYRRRMNELADRCIDDGRSRALLRDAGRSEAAAHLCRRRRHQRRSGGTRCASSPNAFGIPVVTTLMGIGAIDTTHPLCMHMLGMHGTAFANYAVEDCDFLIALGARFDDRVAGVPRSSPRKAKRIAHIDIDAPKSTR